MSLGLIKLKQTSMWSQQRHFRGGKSDNTVNLLLNLYGNVINIGLIVFHSGAIDAFLITDQVPVYRTQDTACPLNNC